MSREYGFIVDTNKYSGNFERQMCAFMTGHIGWCEVGKNEANEYLTKFSKVKGVIQKADEHGVKRPVRIETTPGVWNNGMGFHFVDGQEELALQKHQEEIRKYHEDWITRKESYRGKKIPTWTDEAIDREVQGHKDAIIKAMTTKEVSKYPAYQSVLIHFEETLDEATIDFLKERAYEFATRHGEGLEIRGFRVL